MLHFIDPKNVGSICSEKGIVRYAVPIHADTGTSPLFELFCLKYPNVREALDRVIKSNGNDISYDRIITINDEDRIIYVYVSKTISKFQGYIYDVVDNIERVVKLVEHNPVMVLVPLADDIKLIDSIVINVLAERLSSYTNDIYLGVAIDYRKYISQIDDGIVYSKQDSWEPSWMLTDDDIKFTDILVTAMGSAQGVKLTKAGLVKAYYTCHQHGMFPKIEFFDTEYGKFFKLFIVKTNTLINHGLMVNTFFRAKDGGNKILLTVGPTYPLIKQIAYTKLMKERTSIMAISTKIAEELSRVIKFPRNNSDKSFQPSNDNTNLFSL